MDDHSSIRHFSILGTCWRAASLSCGLTTSLRGHLPSSPTFPSSPQTLGTFLARKTWLQMPCLAPHLRRWRLRLFLTLRGSVAQPRWPPTWISRRWPLSNSPAWIHNTLGSVPRCTLRVSLLGTNSCLAIFLQVF